VVRQAHAYFAGAISGTALIAAAIAAFVLLVSLQALRDWPLAGLGFGSSDGSVERATHARGATGAALPNGKAGAATAGRAPGAGDAAHRNTSHGGTTGLGQSPSSRAGTPTGGPGTAPSGTPVTGTTGGGSGSNGSGSGGDSGGTAGSGRSVSGTVTGTVNETVSGVNQTTGGALDEAGVTKVSEEAVNGLAGPETPVGKTVDGVVETVGGVLRGSGP
jgi:hypothetical protein